MKILISLIIVQMNIVCAGSYGKGGLTSCEVNKAGERSWSPMTSLPGVRFLVQGLNIGSEVLMMGNIRLVNTIITSLLQYSGGRDGTRETSYRDEIYSLDLNTEEWKLVDNFNIDRGAFGVSSVESNLFDFCK